MPKNISLKDIKKFKNKFLKNNKNIALRNALIKNDLNTVALNWENFSQINHHFSNLIKKELPVTNQKASGRCWGFAGLNLMRLNVVEKLNLTNFEFSQNYFMFWDKFEKANYFLENIIKTRDHAYDSRLIMHLVKAPVQDGGQWDMFVNLIEKYGAVPKDVMPETNHSSKSMAMNYILTHKLREFASILRKKPLKNSNSLKKEMMEVIYNLLSMFLGQPPEEIKWSTRNTENKYISMSDITPYDFYKKYADINIKDKVCLIHAPMSNKKFNTMYTVEYLGNVIEGQIIKYLNVDMQELKKSAMQSIKNNEAVWFGCDVGKRFSRDMGVLDMGIYDYENIFQTSFKMNKQTRLEYGDSEMTHAMLLTGVDIKKKNSIKWKIENSWGPKSGNQGYMMMTDEWFDEYTYEVVVDKKYLSKKLLKYLNTELISLAPWDPMGALAGYNY
ncbi:C1 family peptidase [Alphaproteobacteria bacterium]|nr:C1 family peptidase [Alphaproteobacteria bacterium]